MTLRERLIEGARESTAGRWFDGLNQRDSTMVVVLGAALLALFVFTFVWLPIHDWSNAAQARHEKQRTLLEWMKANESAAREAARSTGGGGAGTQGSLLTLVANSAAESGIQLTRVQPEANGVSVMLQSQAFSEVLRWLGKMADQHHVTIRQVSMDRQSAAGIVNARITFG